MDRDKLQNLLDSLDEGPLGTRSDGQWDQYYSLRYNSEANAKDKKIREKISKNTDWKALRAKQVANTDYTKHREMFRHYSKQRRRSIKVFKVKKVKGKIVSKTYFNTYESILKCSIELDLIQGGISNILNPNHIAKTYKGYTFEYV